MILICFIITAGCNKDGYINPVQTNTNSDKVGLNENNETKGYTGMQMFSAGLVCGAIVTATALIIVYKASQSQLNAAINNANRYRNCMHRADKVSELLYEYIEYLNQTVEYLCARLVQRQNERQNVEMQTEPVNKTDE
ncbi:MAG: hypothetical protein LBN01_05180 [Endomicrobium sp.]|jgi:hypothetical protein|nr:hypothetical protein [Endomicrobium sp.]